MIKEFRSYVGNRILGWFLTHPTRHLSMNELARELGVSVGSVKRYADLLVHDDLVTLTQAGTAHLLSLNNDEPVVRELKRSCMVLLLRENGITGIAPNAISLALYGSITTGTYDEKSDIDILIIGDEGEVLFDRVPAIEQEIGYELQVTVVPYHRWEEKKRTGDTFTTSVLARHILLAGVEL